MFSNNLSATTQADKKVAFETIINSAIIEHFLFRSVLDGKSTKYCHYYLKG